MTGSREPKARYRTKRVRRVNARLDPQTARKLDELIRARKLNVTDVLKEAIDALHRKFTDERRPTPHEVALKVGLIGCVEGPEDLSTHKRYLYDYLARKYPQHLG